MKNARNFNIARLWNASRILLDSNANMKISNLNVKVSYTNDDFDITRLWNASRILLVSVSFVFWPLWCAVLLCFFSSFFLTLTFCIFVWLSFVFLYFVDYLLYFCIRNQPTTYLFWPSSAYRPVSDLKAKQPKEK